MRIAKQEQVDLLESFAIEALSVELCLCLERAYAAVALLDERASGPAQFHSCRLGSDMERSLELADAIKEALSCQVSKDIDAFCDASSV